MTSQLFRMISTPLIDAFIGWITTYLAIRMIFRPRRPVNLLVYRLQGIMPKRRGELARSIAQTVEQHLVSHADVMRILEGADFGGHLDELIQEKIHDFFENRLMLSNPMLGMLFKGSLREKVEALLGREVRRMIPEMTAQMMEKLEESLDFQQIVEERVNAFDMDQLEQIVYGIAKRELRAIELICGVLGFVIGLVHVGLMLL